MKILHTNFHRGWGGQTNRILTVCLGLAARGHEVALAVPRASALAERAKAAGLDAIDRFHFARGFRPAKIMGDAALLRQLVRDRGFHIVHTHGSQDAWVAAWALGGRSNRPIVLRTKHNLFPIADHFFNRKLYGSWTDGLIGISEAIVEYCAAKPYIDAENLDLIHSAVDLERFRGERDRRTLEEFGLENQFVAGVIGRLRPEKGHRYLIEALPAVVQEAPDFALLVVGGGSGGGELKGQVKRLGLDSRVHFTGFRNDVPEILSALDLFIMPSISEGLGTAILEAAAVQLPIVATAVGGIPDIIADGERGLLVPPADPDALSRAIVTLYRDRRLARQFGTRAGEFVQDRFSQAALVDKTEAVYRKWIGRKQ